MDTVCSLGLGQILKPSLLKFGLVLTDILNSNNTKQLVKRDHTYIYQIKSNKLIDQLKDNSALNDNEVTHLKRHNSIAPRLLFTKSLQKR